MLRLQEFLKTQHVGASPRCGHDKSRTTSESGALHARLDMLLTFADAEAKRPSRSQQIPYDAHRSANRPSDISAADARAQSRTQHLVFLDDVFAQKSMQDCRP